MAYYFASERDKAIMHSEFYGEPVDEEVLLTDADPTTKFINGSLGLIKLRMKLGEDSEDYKRITTSVYVKLVKIWDKGLITPFLVHKIMWEYTQISSPEDMAEMCLALGRNCCFLKMIHTIQGALVAVQVIKASSGTKLKQASNELKGQVAATAGHPYGSWVLLCLLRYGDKEQLHRTLVPEIWKNVDQILSSTAAGSGFICTLLSGKASRYLAVLPHGFLDMDERSIQSKSVKLSEAELRHHGEKDQAELVQATDLLSTFGEADTIKTIRHPNESMEHPWAHLLTEEMKLALISHCRRNIKALLCTGSPSKSVLIEVLSFGMGLSAEQDDLIDEIVRLSSLEDTEILNHFHGSRNLRLLIMKEPTGNLAKRLREKLRPRWEEIEKSHGKKILEALTK